MNPTLEEISRKVGVSRQAVSYALNNRRGQVSDSTRRRVLAAAKELAYRPNASARATRTGRHGCIDLLTSTHRSYSRLPTELLESLGDALASHHSRMGIFRLPDESLSDDESMSNIFHSRSSDGLLVNYTHGIPDGVTDLLNRYRIPAVWLHAKLDHDCVYTSESETYRRATARLVELGHRRIGYCALHRSGHFSEDERQNGYRLAMRDAGLKPVFSKSTNRPIQFYTQHPEQDDRLATLRAWLESSDRPTAIVVYGNIELMMLAFAATGLGLQIPRDLTLVALNDEGYNPLRGMNINVWRIEIPQREIAQRAVEMVMQKIASPEQFIDPVSVPLRLTDDHLAVAPPRPKPSAT